MYCIEIEPENQLVSVRLGGMVTADEVAKYIAELKRKFIAHHLRSYVLVVDISDCPIQSQDMMRAMGEHMTHMPKARAIAVVTGSSLARMQVRRLFTQPYTRITDTLAQARNWVLNGAEPLAA